MLKPACTLALLLVAGPAFAQAAVNGTSPYADAGAGSGIKSKAEDEGRYVPNDRDGLIGRGSGANTNRTYGATIGSTIGSQIGGAIGVGGPQNRPR